MNNVANEALNTYDYGSKNQSIGDPIEDPKKQSDMYNVASLTDKSEL